MKWRPFVMSLCSCLLPGWFSPADAQPFAYVANQRSSAVSVVNTANITVAATVPVGASPFGVAITPNGPSPIWRMLVPPRSR